MSQGDTSPEAVAGKGLAATAWFGGVLVVLSVPLLLGGFWLLALGGGPFYLFAGLALAISGAMVLQARALGLWIFLSAVISTVIWSISEIGLSFGMMAHVAPAAALALRALFLLPLLTRNPRLRKGKSRNTLLWAGTVVIVGGVVVLAILVSYADELAGAERVADFTGTATSLVPGNP